MKKSFPLSKVYGLLEPGPVTLVTTAQKDAQTSYSFRAVWIHVFTPSFMPNLYIEG